MTEKDKSVSKELEAIIELTAKKTVEEALLAYDKKMADKIEIHRLTCQAGKLGAFKASVIGILSAVATLVGNWALKKI